MVVNYGMPSHKLEDVRRLNTLQHGICKSYLEPTKTNNIRYVLTAPKSHSNYGRNWCEEAPFLWKTVSYGPTMSHKGNLHTKTVLFFIGSHPNSTRLYSRHFKYPSKVWFNTSFLWLAPKWFVPFQALLEIYRKINCQQLLLLSALCPYVDWSWYSNF